MIEGFVFQAHGTNDITGLAKWRWTPTTGL